MTAAAAPPPEAKQTDIEDGILIEDEATTKAVALENQRLLEFVGNAQRSLPGFAGGVPNSKITLKEALEELRQEVYPSVFSDSPGDMATDLFIQDAESGDLLAVRVTMSYESRGMILTRRGFLAILYAVRLHPTTPKLAAHVVGQALWRVLCPGKLTITFKPTGKMLVHEGGKFTRKESDDSSTVFNIHEETMRLSLSLQVPTWIRHFASKEGPTDIEFEGAGDASRELLIRMKRAPNDEELILLAKMVAIASFDPQGIEIMQLKFHAHDYGGGVKKAAETDETTDTSS